MTLGPEDYALAADCTTDPDALMVPSMLVAQAAAAAGIRALGFVGSIAAFGEPEVFAQRIAQARRLGFKGAQVIHPAQVSILNELFSPSADDLAWARRVLDATERAVAEGLAAFTVDGKMVDRPIIERARRIVASARGAASADR
jgi:citrate lyase subunit beta/citryl-CoA lyase